MDLLPVGALTKLSPLAVPVILLVLVLPAWETCVGAGRLAVGDWRLVVVGGSWWWLAAAGGWGLVVDGGWRLVAVGGWWRLVGGITEGGGGSIEPPKSGGGEGSIDRHHNYNYY